MGGFIPAMVSVRLSDGMAVDVSPAAKPDSFRGFISEVLISSVTILAAPTTLHAIDNLVVGMASPVPEGHAAVLLLLGLSGLVFMRQRPQARLA